MGLFDFLKSKFKMRNFFNLLIFFSTFTFSQSAKEFLLNDNEKIMSKVNLSDVISESKNYEYNFVRDKNQNYIFKDGGFSFVAITKEIDSNNPEVFPNYSVGQIIKRYFFLGDDIDDKCIILKVDTQIRLIEYENVSAIQIKNCFSKIKKDIINVIEKNNWVTINNSNKINYETDIFSTEYIDVLEEKALRKKSDFNDVFMDHFFLNGISFKNVTISNGNLIKNHSFYFSFEDLFFRKTEESLKKAEKIFLPFEESRYKIGNQDIREINQFDLEAMVKFFIEDCKRINKNVPKINSLKATFETLDGEKIALAYGLGDDTSIIIKVDPVKWENSNIVKRWYIIYHELGHDVLNLEHGQGGKMMYNFADKEYSWDDFFNDKDYMIYSIKDKVFSSEIETVKIGNQEWTVENLDVSRYRNGDIIPEVNDPKEWANLKTGAWCYYYNDPRYGKIYGKLYNWYAVNDPRGLAPEGFHIPSDTEWTKLTDYLGGREVAGGKMKAIGTSLWNSPNNNATNDSGFSGLPGASRSDDGTYGLITYHGHWWSLSEFNIITDAWCRYLHHSNGLAYKSWSNKKNGFSVRCLRD